MSSTTSSSFAGITLTTPAIVTLIGYLILCVLIVSPFDMYAWDEKENEYERYRYNFWQRLLLLILLLFPLLLAVYSVNCFMVGKCVILSWAVALVTLLWAIAVIIAAIINRSFRLDDVLN